MSTTQLVVSFVGDVDLAVAGLQDTKKFEQKDSEKSDGSALSVADEMPTWRLLTRLGIEKRLADDAVVLLLDDKPGDRCDPTRAASSGCEALSKRERFGQILQDRIRSGGLGARHVRVVPLAVKSNDPTNLTELFEASRKLLSASPWRERLGRAIFHVSSGTPAMYASQFLLALTLSNDAEVWQTSRQRASDTPEALAGAEQKLRDFVIGIRRATRYRAPRNAPASVAGKKLAAHRVANDAAAAAAFNKLANIVKRKDKARPKPWVLLVGPAGCGKWEAARQFADWYGGEFQSVVRWQDLVQFQEKHRGVLIRHLNAWDDEGLDRLHTWISERPHVALAATWLHSGASESHHHRRVAYLLSVELPAPASRDDVSEVAKRMLKAAALHEGKFDERLLADVLAQRGWTNFHDLKQLLLSAGASSESGHIDEAAWQAELQRLEAQELRDMLRDIQDILATGRFTAVGSDPPARFKDLSNAQMWISLKLAVAGGLRTQADVAKSFSLPQATVSKWLHADTNDDEDYRRAMSVITALRQRRATRSTSA